MATLWANSNMAQSGDVGIIITNKEADGLVSRTVFAEMPPRVEYEITQKARGLGPTMEALTTWWNQYGKVCQSNRLHVVEKPKAARLAMR